MLDQVIIDDNRLTKEEYKLIHDHLITRLVELQQKAWEEQVGLVMVFEGWNGAGKGSRISDLVYNLDARATHVSVTPEINIEEARLFKKLHQGVSGYHPFLQEFWKALGPRGSITIFDRAWYFKALQEVLFSLFGTDFGKKKTQIGKKKRKKLEAHLQTYLSSIADFEEQLVNDGYVVLKFFLHISEQEQKKRLSGLYNDPSMSWRVSKSEIKRLGNYQHSYSLYDALIEQSDFAAAPWTLINAEDKRRANLDIAAASIQALKFGLERNSEKHLVPSVTMLPKIASTDGVIFGGEGTFSAQEGAASVQKGAAEQSNVATQSELPAADVTTQGELPAADVTTQGDARGASDTATQGDARGASDTATQGDALNIDVVTTTFQDKGNSDIGTRFLMLDEAPSLDRIDRTLALSHDEYHAMLKAEQARFHDLEVQMYLQRIPLLIMFEGWDAAGKGGAIKRVAQALDARSYEIFPSPAPTVAEKLHPHLWRYWTRLPKAGHVGIYDRSWYGRVLVERVEGYASELEWGRAFDEINAFERDMASWGAILVKFWVEVSKEEQLLRFKEREANPQKRWKITAEDWRNREKYPLYKTAVEDMFAKTSTKQNPWQILESENKYYARGKALRIVNDTLEGRLR